MDNMMKEILIMPNAISVLDKLSDTLSSDSKIELIELGYAPVKFLAGDKRVRIALAKNGYFLNELSRDKDFSVRMEVLKKGFDSLCFLDDESEEVRALLADMGVCLDILYKDQSPLVREHCARNGAHLKELSMDKHPNVRAAVASKSKDKRLLKRLVGDEDRWVGYIASCFLDLVG